MIYWIVESPGFSLGPPAATVLPYKGFFQIGVPIPHRTGEFLLNFLGCDYKVQVEDGEIE